MWRKFDRFDRETCFVAWGISIARNIVRGYFSSKKNSRLQFNDRVIQMIDTAACSEASDTQLRLNALQRCYEQMSESNRMVIKLRYNSGLTIKAIAGRLNKPIQGMYKRLSRLHDSLLQCIEKTMDVSEELP
jgi:RNA polymerase sigma-70 factor (ECF subfamily)